MWPEKVIILNQSSKPLKDIFQIVIGCLSEKEILNAKTSQVYKFFGFNNRFMIKIFYKKNNLSTSLKIVDSKGLNRIKQGVKNGISNSRQAALLDTAKKRRVR